MYSGRLLTQSTIPVVSAGRRSLDDRTTGWSPAVRHAFTIPGSPSHANTLAWAIAPGVLNGDEQKKLALPSRLHCSTTSPRCRRAASIRSFTRPSVHSISASSRKSRGVENACGWGTTSWSPTFDTAAPWSWPIESFRIMSPSSPCTPPG